MSNKKFSESELAYICYNVKETENKQLCYDLKLVPDDVYDENEIVTLLTTMFKDLTDSEKEELSGYTFEYMNDYLVELGNAEITEKENKRLELKKTNPFFNCIENNLDKFEYQLLGIGNDDKIHINWKQTCKELLIESVKIYSTGYRDEYYIKTGENTLEYIGTDYETYLENLYSMISFKYTTLIPFSSFISSIKKLRIYEKLEPNRDYILFNDCLLNINSGETIENAEITFDKIPYRILDYNYLDENKDVQEYIFELFERIDTNNIIKSLMYGMFNKRVLKKTTTIFNIQKSNTGKTLLISPLIEIGLFNNVNHDMLNGYERTGLFKQYYSVIFEEIQDTVINGSSFNSLNDNTSMSIQRKYKEPITIPKELKPVIYINGESMPNFKGRTKGSFNRFVFIPDYKESLTENDYEYITENIETIAIELLRHLIEYMKLVSKDVIRDNIENAKKTEKEIIQMKENKVKIIFRYIKSDPEINRKTKYCISETMLVDLIMKLQIDGFITVDLFNSPNTIKTFIKNTLIEQMDTDITLEENVSKRVKYKDKWKTQRLKEIFELTEDGKTFITDMGYKLSSLQINYESE